MGKAAQISSRQFRVPTKYRKMPPAKNPEDAISQGIVAQRVGMPFSSN
jgi:hypothetical protein